IVPLQKSPIVDGFMSRLTRHREMRLGGKEPREHWNTHELAGVRFASDGRGTVLALTQDALLFGTVDSVNECLARGGEEATGVARLAGTASAFQGAFSLLNMANFDFLKSVAGYPEWDVEVPLEVDELFDMRAGLSASYRSGT